MEIDRQLVEDAAAALHVTHPEIASRLTATIADVDHAALPPAPNTPEEAAAYHVAMDAMCATMRGAVFTARDAGISVDAMREEAEAALLNALDDADDPEVVA